MGMATSVYKNGWLKGLMLSIFLIGVTVLLFSSNATAMGQQVSEEEHKAQETASEQEPADGPAEVTGEQQEAAGMPADQKAHEAPSGKQETPKYQRVLIKETIYHKEPSEVTIEELFRVADCVVRGRVTEIKCAEELVQTPKEVIAYKEQKRGASEREFIPYTAIYTYVTFKPAEWFKKPLNYERGKDIVIKMPGGTVKDENGIEKTEHVSLVGGAPIFRKGEELVVFLRYAGNIWIKGEELIIERDPRGYFAVLLNARGEYKVSEKNNMQALQPFYEKEPVPLEVFRKNINKIKEGEK